MNKKNSTGFQLGPGGLTARPFRTTQRKVIIMAGILACVFIVELLLMLLLHYLARPSLVLNAITDSFLLTLVLSPVFYKFIIYEIQMSELARDNAGRCLVESEARYRSYIEVTGQLGWVTNAAGEIEEDVPSLRKFSGQTYEEAKGSGWVKTLHPDDLAHTLEVWNKAVAEKSRYDVRYRMRRHDGIYRHFLARGFPVTGEDGSLKEWVGTCIDITEHIQESEALRRIEWLLTKSAQPKLPGKLGTPSAYGDVTVLNTNRLILNSVGERVLADITDDYLDLLDTCAAIYEKNGDYAYGVFTSDWCRFMDETSRTLCGTQDNKVALSSGRWVCHESCWNEASKVSMETGQPADIECKGGIRIYAVPIRAGNEIIGSINFGYGNPPSDPQKIKELSLLYGVKEETLSVLAGSYQTRPAYMIAIAKKRLVTSAELIGEIVERTRVETERESIRGQLQQAQKMEAIGLLAGGVAHDFNNILTAIKGYGAMVAKALLPEDPSREDMREIMNAADRATTLTRQLLAFSRRQVISPKLIDLNKMLGDMMNMLQRIIGENVQLSTKLFHAPCLARIDPGQIEHVIVNLVVNARDAISKGGEITLETEIKTPPEEFFLTYPDMPRGPLVHIKVRDNGCGMSSELIQHIFEPFFTTKAQGKGTGLGLSMVYGIVKQSGGNIEVESQPGKGSVFNLYFPLVEGGTPESSAGKAAIAVKAGTETVLLVEDDESLRRLGARLLKELGYTAICAVDGKDALNVIERHGRPVDLLLTDVVMPGMGGPELAAELERRKLTRRTLYMSGYTDDTIVKQGVLAPGIAFIYKPFTVEALALKLREVLDGPADKAKA